MGSRVLNWKALRASLSAIASLPLTAGLILALPLSSLAQEDATCAMCHSSRSMFQGLPNADSLVVTPEALAASVHGDLGLTCVMCHQDLMAASLPHAAELERAKCEACHVQAGREFNESLHGYALSRGNLRAPSCASCHGSHEILRSSNENSRTHRAKVTSTCANCHGGGLLTDQLVKLPESVLAYTLSVHGRASERGVEEAASCTDCHGVHDIRHAEDPTSRINRVHISATCGQCHEEIKVTYEGSIHGRALAAGIHDSPTCTDCHGEHLILSPKDPGAKTADRRMATETCGECHDDPVIVAKYNLRRDVVGSYVDSYHGWASRRGAEQVATCVDCHTVHAVLPAADSASSVSRVNVVATCQQCHPDASLRFAESYDHEQASITANPVNRVIRTVYLWAIALIIGGMVLHNLVVISYFIIERRQAEKRTSLVLRLDRLQLLQHSLVTVSFIMLVVTGFALRFPEAWWVEILTDLGMTEGVRADLHRVSAVVLIATALFHIYYVLFTRRGSSEFKAMIPERQDLKDAYENVRFHLWRRREKVRFGRYDYTQKAEYWGLVWGTVLMVLTGFVLWFPARAVTILPVWAVPAAQTIHYYEAWLATLTIIVWHLFFVIFHPEAYPMSWTWLTGKMSEDFAKRHHPGWYDEITASESGGEVSSDDPTGD